MNRTYTKEELVAVAKSAMCDAFKSIRTEDWDYAILELKKAEGAFVEIMRQCKEAKLFS